MNPCEAYLVADLNEGNAIALCREICSKVSSHHFSPDSFGVGVRRGVENFEMGAMGEPSDCSGAEFLSREGGVL